MKRLSIFALAVCLFPAAASATDYSYRFYVPLDLTAVGPPGSEAVLNCGASKNAQGMNIDIAHGHQDVILGGISTRLDSTGSLKGTLYVDIHYPEPLLYYRCAFEPRYDPKDPYHDLPPSLQFPPSMLRGVSGTLPDGKNHRPTNRNQMQMNRGNATVPPPMRLR